MREYKNWDEVKAKLVELWTAFEEKIPGLAATMKNIYEGSIKPTIDGIKTTFQGLISFISGVFSGDWTKAWEGAKTSFSGCFQALPEFAKGPLNLVISLANKAIAGLNSLGSFTVPDWVPGVGGKSMGINIPQIPMLASGGIATGPSLAMVGEGREPLGRHDGRRRSFHLCQLLSCDSDHRCRSGQRRRPVRAESRSGRPEARA